MTSRSKNVPKEWSVGENLVTGMTAFIAPLVGLAAVASLTSSPHTDVRKAIARLRHANRLRLSSRQGVIKDAVDHGYSVDDAARNLKLSDTEVKRLIEEIRARDGTATKQVVCHL